MSYDDLCCDPMNITEAQMTELQKLANHYDLGSIMYHDELLELPSYGLSVDFGNNLYSWKTLLGEHKAKAYTVYETIGFEMDADLIEHSVHATLRDAVHSMFSRALEMQILHKMHKVDLSQGYEEIFND